MGDEGRVFGALGRRRASARRPSSVRAHGTLDAKSGVKKARSAAENTPPSICMVHGTPAAPARRHAVHEDSKQGAADPAPPTLATLPTCFRTPATAADSMGLASFIPDHIHTMRSGQRWSVDHRQACDGRLFGHIIQPTLDYVASVIRTLYSVKESTQLSAGTER